MTHSVVEDWPGLITEVPGEWLELTTRVTADTLPRSTNAGYLVAETKDNAPSVLRRGAQLWGQGVPAIATQQGGEGFGFCGFDYSASELVSFGVPREVIIPVPYSFEDFGGVVNTFTELLNLARFGKKEKWGRMFLVAPMFHQLRSFITMVTAVDHEYPELKVYNCVGAYLPWGESVVHSQGTTGTRLDLVVGEIKRIQAYQQNGKPYPLVSVERALEYLDQRDAV